MRVKCGFLLLLPLSTLKLFHKRGVATFVKSYRTLDVSYELMKGEYTAGTPIFLKVAALSRDAEEEEEVENEVVAPFFASQKKKRGRQCTR